MMSQSPNDTSTSLLRQEAAAAAAAAAREGADEPPTRRFDTAPKILAFSSSPSASTSTSDGEQQSSKSTTTNTTTRARHVPHWQEAVAGALAGAFSRTAMAPLERIKLLKQLQGSLPTLPRSTALDNNSKAAITSTTTRISNNTNNPSAWSLARHVYQTEGLASFWRGNWPSCLRVSGTAAINFTCLEYYQAAAVRPFLDRFFYTNATSNTSSQQRQAQFWSSLIAGGLAGATSTTILYPLEFVRTRLAVDLGTTSKMMQQQQPQKPPAPLTTAAAITTTTGANSTNATATTTTTMQRPRQYRGMHHVFVDILRSDGIRGLYQGYGIALTGGIVYRVMYLGGYDAMKKEIQWQRDNKVNNNHSNSDSNHASTHTGTSPAASPAAAAAAAAASSSSTMTWTERFLVAQTISLTAGTLSYPFDSVRRRMMMQAGKAHHERMYRNSLHCIATVYGAEGIRGFYLGLAPNLVRSLGGALMLVAYDAVRGLL
jgi:solute carrier family 25 (mitochondrial adenine nucleotide translocator), member 4/5/6/31